MWTKDKPEICADRGRKLAYSIPGEGMKPAGKERKFRQCRNSANLRQSTKDSLGAVFAVGANAGISVVETALEGSRGEVELHRSITMDIS